VTVVPDFIRASVVIREVQQAEHLWFAQGDPYSPTLPWMPFQPAEFLSILFECVPEMTGRAFLDVGCGPGTKMLLASHFYGLEVQGVEINPVMAVEAETHGSVWVGDALSAPPGFYREYDLVWLYRPFRDAALETQLETRLMNEMKPGAILAGASWELSPAERQWIPVVDEWDLPRGAWMKPRLVTDLEL
jgi:SAM-dependent methyltransferase